MESACGEGEDALQHVDGSHMLNQTWNTTNSRTGVSSASLQS